MRTRRREVGKCMDDRVGWYDWYVLEHERFKRLEDVRFQREPRICDEGIGGQRPEEGARA